MKKLLMLVLVSACIVGLLVGCTKGSNYKPVQVENVSISIEDVSSTGGIVIIKDTNEEPYTYGEWYKIEKNSNGKWIEVDTVISDYGFNEIAYLTNEDGEVRFAIDWQWLYGELSPGNYRLLKEVANKYIAVEFNVEAK